MVVTRSAIRNLAPSFGGWQVGDHMPKMNPLRQPFILSLVVALSGCPAALKSNTCEVDSECVPDPGSSEAKTCVKGTAAQQRDSTTPFDEGYRCGCVEKRCQLVPGPQLKGQINQAARKFAAALFPNCKDNLRALELSETGGDERKVFTDCHCRDDCGSGREFDLNASGATGRSSTGPARAP